MLLSWASHKGEALLMALVTGVGEKCMVPTGVMREATLAPESSTVWEEYKTCAEQLQNPAPPYTHVSPYSLAT